MDQNAGGFGGTGTVPPILVSVSTFFDGKKGLSFSVSLSGTNPYPGPPTRGRENLGRYIF
jgi:hypothetical protein